MPFWTASEWSEIREQRTAEIERRKEYSEAAKATLRREEAEQGYHIETTYPGYPVLRRMPASIPRGDSPPPLPSPLSDASNTSIDLNDLRDKLAKVEAERVALEKEVDKIRAKSRPGDISPIPT